MINIFVDISELSRLMLVRAAIAVEEAQATSAEHQRQMWLREAATWRAAADMVKNCPAQVVGRPTEYA